MHRFITLSRRSNSVGHASYVNYRKFIAHGNVIICIGNEMFSY